MPYNIRGNGFEKRERGGSLSDDPRLKNSEPASPIIPTFVTVQSRLSLQKYTFTLCSFKKIVSDSSELFVMSDDASAAALSPMINGTVPSGSHREADASTSTPPQRSGSLAEVCADLHQRVTNFLNAAPESEVVRRTQEQTRTSIRVIEKALQDYGYVHSLLLTSAGPLRLNIMHQWQVYSF